MDKQFGMRPQNVSGLLGDTLPIQCPYCHITFNHPLTRLYLGKDSDGEWGVSGTLCPTCERLILYLEKGERSWLMGGTSGSTGELNFKALKSRLIRPEFVLPEPIPKDTPSEIVEDYREAATVLAFSPKASAALSRRCLQNIIRERSAQDIKGFKQGDLHFEIDQVMNSKSILNANLNEMLHGVRIVGNFAAHPNKSKNTGLIMPVEPNEAAFNLSVIDKLLFYYYTELPQEQKILEEIKKKPQESKKS